MSGPSCRGPSKHKISRMPRRSSQKAQHSALSNNSLRQKHQRDEQFTMHAVFEKCTCLYMWPSHGPHRRAPSAPLRGNFTHTSCMMTNYTTNFVSSNYLSNTVYMLCQHLFRTREHPSPAAWQSNRCGLSLYMLVQVSSHFRPRVFLRHTLKVA